jgi:hypothetical protein
MDAAPFDLYADVIASQPDDPLVGLFVQDVDIEHVADLYAQTSARYVFSAWLVQALHEIIVPERSAATPEPAEERAAYVTPT